MVSELGTNKCDKLSKSHGKSLVHSVYSRMQLRPNGSCPASIGSFDQIQYSVRNCVMHEIGTGVKS